VQAAERGVGLLLAGHTHGGQTWPLHLFTYLIFPDAFAGLYR
jgi:predicted MPP superfamily phosphohydrolase